MKDVSIERIQEIIRTYSVYGNDKTCELYNIKPTTLNRYLRYARNDLELEVDVKSKYLQEISKVYSEKELRAIAKGGRLMPGMSKVPVVEFDGERISIGVIGDTHLGSSYTDTELLFKAFDEFEKENVDMVVHTGDVCEGMSNRSGHIYELSHLGYAAQKEHAIEVLSQWSDTPIYMVSGNHDLWFKKSNGADVVNDICEVIPNAEYLGEHEGDISLNGKGILKLWHGGDGNSYAISYRLQKIIEAITGGEKPDMLIAGHVHKSMYMYDRHVHVYSAGAIQRQTPWMRGKRIASHTGFWIVEVWVNSDGISKTKGCWYPYYA